MKRPGSRSQPSYYGQRAAAAARRIYAHQEALATLQKAFALLADLPQKRPRDTLTAQLQERWAICRAGWPSMSAARAAYEKALNSHVRGEAVARARLHRKIGKTLANGEG
jgi:hypothetical protein